MNSRYPDALLAKWLALSALLARLRGSAAALLRRVRGWLGALLDRLERAHHWFVRVTGRLEPLLSLGAIGMALLWVLGTWDVDPNPDAYYHLGVAASYVAALSEGSWLDAFPMLPFTILANEPFPNVYLLQHLMLAPLTRVMGATNAIYAAMGITGFALLASIYFVLRGWQVRGAIWWTQLPWLISPSLFAYVVLLKGATFFLIWTVWAIDAMVRRNYWQLLLFSVLAGYSYVASYLLIPIAGCFALATLLYRRRVEWQGVAATTVGWLFTIFVNPGFPSNLKLVWIEFGNALTFPGAWEAGIWIGAEWSGLSLHSLAISLGFALVPWVVLLPLLPAAGNPGRTLGGCLIVSIMALVLAFYAGSKGVAVAAVVYCLLLPLAMHRLSGSPPAGRPWMTWVVLIWLCSLFGYSRWQGYNPHSERTQPSFVNEARYLARIANLEAGDYRVILAPWYDFPWLFYFNPRNYYVAGMNLLFLQESPEQLAAYHQLFGGHTRNPEIILPRCFLSNLIVMYREPGLQGEYILLQRLREKSEYFSEVEFEIPTTRVFFKLNEEAVQGRLTELQEAEDPLPLCIDPPELVGPLQPAMAPSMSPQPTDGAPPGKTPPAAAPAAAIQSEQGAAVPPAIGTDAKQEPSSP